MSLTYFVYSRPDCPVMKKQQKPNGAKESISRDVHSLCPSASIDCINTSLYTCHLHDNDHPKTRQPKQYEEKCKKKQMVKTAPSSGLMTSAFDLHRGIRCFSSIEVLVLVIANTHSVGSHGQEVHFLSAS